ncbi:MAG: hypothetical protein R3F39_03595 [Myxococcota bacterium]
MRIDATGERLSQLLLRAAELRQKQAQHRTHVAKAEVAQIAAKRSAETAAISTARLALTGGGQAVPGQMMALLEDARAADSASISRIELAMESGQAHLDSQRDALRQAGRKHLRAAHIAAYVETQRRSEAAATEQRHLEEDARAHRFNRPSTR